MMNAVMIFLIFRLTSSSFAVSMLILTFLIPQVVFSLIGGIIADLRSKKRILVLCNISRAIVIIPLLFNADSAVVIYLVALTLSTITQFYIPAESPLIPNLVNRKDLLVANSVFGLNLFGSTLIGYVLAGPLLQLIGDTWTFFVVLLLYACAGVLATLIPTKNNVVPSGQNNSSTKVRKSLREEVHNLYVLLRYTKEAGSSFFLLAFSQVVILVLANIVPGYAEHVLNTQVENLSLFVFAPAAIGMVAASIVLASFLKNMSRNYLMNIGVFLSGIVLICFPGVEVFVRLSPIQYLNTLPGVYISPVTLVPLLAFLAGFANAFIFVPSQTVVHELIPESSRSKIFGLLYALIGAFSLVPIVISGGIADVFGVRSVLVTLGGIIILLGISRVRKKP